MLCVNVSVCLCDWVFRMCLVCTCHVYEGVRVYVCVIRACD